MSSSWLYVKDIIASVSCGIHISAMCTSRTLWCWSIYASPSWSLMSVNTIDWSIIVKSLLYDSLRGTKEHTCTNAIYLGMTAMLGVHMQRGDIDQFFVVSPHTIQCKKSSKTSLRQHWFMPKTDPFVYLAIFPAYFQGFINVTLWYWYNELHEGNGTEDPISNDWQSCI